jgi:L-ascorbate metabolism protein UlaG (beta-lactamase superfamily)
MDFEGVSIERVYHDCIKIKSDKVIYIDPFEVPIDSEKADLILLTHEHFDHCSPADISKVSTNQTIVLTVPDSQSKISNIDLKEVVLIEPGKKVKVLGMLIEAVPAYNIDKWRSPGIPYHPKDNEMVGYVINIGGKRIYHAGDTDKIPEMAELENIDVALLPVSGKYVMTAVEAAEACALIKPRLAIPMHYGAIVGTSADAEIFKQRASCDVRII